MARTISRFSPPGRSGAGQPPIEAVPSEGGEEEGAAHEHQRHAVVDAKRADEGAKERAQRLARIVELVQSLGKRHGGWHQFRRKAVGFCGSFTTMSSFALETSNLFDSNRFSLVALNILANVGLSLGAIFGGRVLGDVLIERFMR